MRGRGARATGTLRWLDKTHENIRKQSYWDVKGRPGQDDGGRLIMHS